MTGTRVANRYAKSLLALAAEQGKVDKAFDDMQLVANTCEASHDLSLLLTSPIVKTDKKLSILKEVFGKKVGDLSMAFINIITQKKREGLLEGIANEFVTQYKAFKNISTAEVRSAIPLNKKNKDKVMELIAKMGGHKDVDLTEIVDETIIGGFIVRMGDQQVDASTLSQLNELRKEFNNNPYIPEF